MIICSKVRFKELQKNNVEFGLVYKPGSNTDIFGYVATSFLVQMQQLKIWRAIFYGITEPNLPASITNLY
jgi:hypothetical protein